MTYDQEKLPLVSVIINNYNYGHFLCEAIDSVLNQTYPNIEIVVVDDGSTDNSREIISSYQEKIISVLKENGGQASAFNAGFAASRGDIIFMLDSDDIFVPEKVAEVVNIFEQYQDIGWCFNRLRFVDAKTNTFIKLSSESGSRLCDLRTDIKNGKMSFHAPATSGLCFKRSLLQMILPMPEIIIITSDNYLKVAAVALSKGYFLDKQLSFLRLHNNNNYTARGNNQSGKAKVAILTAYCVRKNWPFLAKSAHKLFSRGLGIAWKVGGLEAEATQIIKSYISTVSPLERLEINLRAFYTCFKV
ncbi:MAG: glycosyltransferase [Gloeocapsa sp. UFS-A4-WI-NPMV-4B04]|jgi:glycosyltransferase involved in cell wall biosynthesis|nr:glycosyltransferase [Gloeocapsa sp. UFS-A4-WI-NPMV-4B04]